MMQTNTIRDLYDLFGAELELDWDGQGGKRLVIKDDAQDTAYVPVAGPFNMIRPNRIQIIGPPEHTHLQSLEVQDYQHCLKRLFSTAPAAIIFTDDLHPTPECASLAGSTDTALLRTRQPDYRIISQLLTHFSKLILGVDVPQTTIPVAPGRNLAIQVESAVRQHLLLLDGCDAADDFVSRQQ